MSEEYIAVYVVIAFALFFPLLWLAIVTIIAVVGGWQRLQDAFPDRPSAHVYKRLSMRTGQLGNPYFGASYNHCLNFDVCEPGLRISVWKIFAPFGKPLFFSWDQLEVEPYQWFIWRSYRLRWGEGYRNSMLIFRGTAEDIAEASRGKFVLPQD